MQQFIDKYGKQIQGVVSGFDRLVFRGSLRGLNYGYWDQNLQAAVAIGMEQYLWHNQILFKDYLDHVKRVSQQVKRESEKVFEQQGRAVLYLRDSAADKDKIAREIAEKKGVQDGLVCAISTVEPSLSFEHRGTHMVRRLKAPMSAILDKPGGQNVSVTLPAGAMLLDSPHTSTTLPGMVGVYWEGLHYSVFLDELLKNAEIVRSA
jgi:hypothetical protein